MEISISWTSPVVKESNSFASILSNLKSLLYIYVMQHYYKINTYERKAMKQRKKGIEKGKGKGSEKKQNIGKKRV